MALGLPEKDALGLVESDDFQYKPLYLSILTDAKRLGLAAFDWIKTNGLEFIEKYCAAAQLASKSSNKYVKIAGTIGSSTCLTDKAATRLPKLETHIRKLQEAKANGTASSNSSASTPTGFSGRSGFELKNFNPQPSRNKPTVIEEVSYSGHALDQMQNRGIPPTIVKNAIKNGTSFETKPGTIGFHDPTNNIMVIMNPEKNTVITVIRGKP